MRKHFLIVIFLFFLALTEHVDAQYFSARYLPNGFFADVNAGIRLGGGRVSPNGSLAPGFHYNAGIGYMFNEIWGVKADAGADFFGVSNVNFQEKDRSLGVRANVQAVLSVSDLLYFGDENFRLLAHGGPGLSTIVNSQYINTVKDVRGALSDPGLGGTDDMFNVVLGITPQFYISDKFSFNIDVSSVFLIAQSHYLDRTYAPDFIGQYSSFKLNVSAGLQYRLVRGRSIRFGSRKYYY